MAHDNDDNGFTDPNYEFYRDPYEGLTVPSGETETRFMQVHMRDKLTCVVNVRDITSIRGGKVEDGNGGEVDGCIIERASSRYAVWCVEPEAEIVERLANLCEVARAPS